MTYDNTLNFGFGRIFLSEQIVAYTLTGLFAEHMSK